MTDTDSPGPSKFASNRLLREVQYPDKASASDVVRNAYNVQSEGTWVQDQAGNVFEMVKDDSGREIHKRVSTLASGFDGAVRRISTTYDGLGRRSLVTQYDNAAVGSGSVTDEVRYTYTDWGDIEAFEQDRNSAVDASGSVDDYEVSYLYEKATGGRNTTRRTRLVMPNGPNINYEYLSTGSLHDDDVSRVTRVLRNLTELAAYQYNGVGLLVGTDYQQPEMFSHLYDGSSYDGLDRFNRAITSRWTKDLTTDVDFVHVDLTYDRNSNITGTVDTVHVDLNATADQPKFDVLYTMDDLNRLTKEEVGDWNGTSIVSDQRQQDWTLDHLGNWSVGKLDLNADGDWSDTDEYNDDRTHNAVNELTGRDTDDNGSDDHTLVYDAVGNLTDDDEEFEYTYDAFGRLRKIEDQGASNVLAEYRYNGLGFMISELADTDDDGDADANDKWFHKAFDERWKVIQEYREDDSSPKIDWLNHNAGLSGRGGSSYIDALVQRRRDTSTDWATEAGDGTYEEKLYYCQNWRHDVVALADFRGGVHEWVKYSAYGVPIGFPAGDDDVSGGTDATDLTRIQDRIDGTAWWAYSVLSDLDLDGDVDASDKGLAQGAYNGITLGYSVLSASQTANRRYTNGLARASLTGALTLNRNRVKDPGRGRWLQRDALGYNDGLNQYEYLWSSPTAFADPLGLSVVDIVPHGSFSVVITSAHGSTTPCPGANSVSGSIEICTRIASASAPSVPASTPSGDEMLEALEDTMFLWFSCASNSDGACACESTLIGSAFGPFDTAVPDVGGVLVDFAESIFGPITKTWTVCRGVVYVGAHYCRTDPDELYATKGLMLKSEETSREQRFRTMRTCGATN